VRVGQVTLVDASGGSWALPLQADGNRLHITVPGDVLAQASYPLAIDPVIGPEFDLDTPVFSPANGNQTSPAIASGGTNCLVAWVNDDGTFLQIVGSRISSFQRRAGSGRHRHHGRSEQSHLPDYRRRRHQLSGRLAG